MWGHKEFATAGRLALCRAVQAVGAPEEGSIQHITGIKTRWIWCVKRLLTHSAREKAASKSPHRQCLETIQHVNAIKTFFFFFLGFRGATRPLVKICGVSTHFVVLLVALATPHSKHYYINPQMWWMELSKRGGEKRHAFMPWGGLRQWDREKRWWKISLNASSQQQT